MGDAAVDKELQKQLRPKRKICGLLKRLLDFTIYFG